MATKLIARLAAGTIGAALLTAPVASAANSAYHYTQLSNGAVYAWNGGAPSSHSTPSYFWFYVKDGKSDGYTVHGNYSNKMGHGSLDNNSGGGTLATKWTGSLITAVQACANHTVLPDECTDWR